MTALNNLTINNPLSLTCNVTTVSGINSSVDIVWMTNGTKFNETRLNVHPENITFTDSVTIPNLTKEKNGTNYQCHVIINVTTLVNATGDYLIGE